MERQRNETEALTTVDPFSFLRAVTLGLSRDEAEAVAKKEEAGR